MGNRRDNNRRARTTSQDKESTSLTDPIENKEGEEEERNILKINQNTPGIIAVSSSEVDNGGLSAWLTSQDGKRWIVSS